MVSTWTQERVELLTKYWLEGLSASNISAKLTGVSRNAVIGKVHRLGLPARAAARGKASSALKGGSLGLNIVDEKDNDTNAKTYWGDGLSENVEDNYIYNRGGETLYDSSISLVLALKNGSCKWPHGDPGESDFRFCGKKSKSGTPYCDQHNKEAYQKITPARRQNIVETMHKNNKKLA